jgi:hypothetical protein
MSGIAIYMEGGGDSANTKAALRRGMDKFLDRLKQQARLKSWNWKLVCCGGRQKAFDAFINAKRQGDMRVVVLLVDAEAPVTAVDARSHLRARDGWDLNGEINTTIHLMAQTMEAWIVADPDTLVQFYGTRFIRKALPRAKNLETVAKADVAAALDNATRSTQKGSYHKIHHASELLARIDPEKVRQRCPSCCRLFTDVAQAIEGA